MTDHLLHTYRTVHEQCFVPIFVRDSFNTDILLEGCQKAGIRAIEYTLRREDANTVIPDLKKQHPEFSVMVGSNLDHPSVIRNMKRIHPQLLSISELIAYPVDGFVSMLSFSDQTIRTLCDDYLLIPSAYTPNEAFHQLTEGAHFLKLSGKNIELIKTCRAAPTFGCMPLFVTGGVNTENMQEIYAAGAMVTASGFDVILKGISPEDASVDLVAERISCFVNTAKQARADKYPSLANTASLCDSYWLNLLPHYHPFS